MCRSTITNSLNRLVIGWGRNIQKSFMLYDKIYFTLFKYLRFGKYIYDSADTQNAFPHITYKRQK